MRATSQTVGRFERAVVARIAGDAEAAFIDEPAVPPRDAGVVELFISEIRTDMTRGAPAFAAKDLNSYFLFGGKHGQSVV